MKREKQVAEFKTSTKQVIEVTVRYELGGMNYFQGVSTPRGYYLGAAPVTKTETMREFKTFSGYKDLLLGADRYSEKVLAALQPTQDQIQTIVNAVAVKNKLTVGEAVAA